MIIYLFDIILRQMKIVIKVICSHKTFDFGSGVFIRNRLYNVFFLYIKSIFNKLNLFYK